MYKELTASKTLQKAANSYLYVGAPLSDDKNRPMSLRKSDSLEEINYWKKTDLSSCREKLLNISLDLFR